MSKFSSLIQSNNNNNNNTQTTRKRSHHELPQKIDHQIENPSKKLRQQLVIHSDSEADSDYNSNQINYDESSSSLSNDDDQHITDNFDYKDPNNIITRTKAEEFKNLEFLLSFKSPKILKKNAMLIAAVIPQCRFFIEVNPKKKFKGFCISSMNDERICAVIAKVACEVYVYDDKVLSNSYAINFDMLVKSLTNTLKPEMTVDIRKFKNSNILNFDLYVEEWSIEGKTFDLDLLDDINIPPIMRFSYYKGYNICIDLQEVNELKEIIKMAKLYNSSSLRFTILKPFIISKSDTEKKIHYILQIKTAQDGPNINGNYTTTFHRSSVWKKDTDDNDPNVMSGTIMNNNTSGETTFDKIEEDKLVADSIKFGIENEIYGYCFGKKILDDITKSMSDTPITFTFFISKKKLDWMQELGIDPKSYQNLNKMHNEDHSDDNFNKNGSNNDKDNDDEDDTEEKDIDPVQNELKIKDNGTLLIGYEIGEKSFVKYILARKREE